MLLNEVRRMCAHAEAAVDHTLRTLPAETASAGFPQVQVLVLLVVIRRLYREPNGSGGFLALQIQHIHVVRLDSVHLQRGPVRLSQSACLLVSGAVSSLLVGRCRCVQMFPGFVPFMSLTYVRDSGDIIPYPCILVCIQKPREVHAASTYR